MTVSGTLAPDAAGPYTRAPNQDGYESWTRTAGTWFLWRHEGTSTWYLSQSVGIPPPIFTPSWYAVAVPESGPFSLNHYGTATGHPTVTRTP